MGQEGQEHLAKVEDQKRDKRDEEKRIKSEVDSELRLKAYKERKIILRK